jgi:hypothetical protein
MPPALTWKVTGPAGTTPGPVTSAVVGVEVRGFEPLASSVRETITVIEGPGRTLGNYC